MENHSELQSKRFDAVYTQQFKSGLARGYKEMLKDFWQLKTATKATEIFTDQNNKVNLSNLDTLKVVERSGNERLANEASYCTHRIPSTVAEDIIMVIKRKVGD